MLNTGLRTGEALGLLNSDIDLENRVVHIQRGVKEVSKREGVIGKSGREVIVGKLKSATSKRDVPLNDTTIEMIKDLRKEFYFGRTVRSSLMSTAKSPDPSTSAKDSIEFSRQQE